MAKTRARRKQMKCYLWSVLVIAFLTAVPALMAQDQDKFEVGAFGEWYRYSNAPTAQNFLGLGARAAVDLLSSPLLPSYVCPSCAAHCVSGKPASPFRRTSFEEIRHACHQISRRRLHAV